MRLCKVSSSTANDTYTAHKVSQSRNAVRSSEAGSGARLPESAVSGGCSDKIRAETSSSTGML